MRARCFCLLLLASGLLQHCAAQDSADPPAADPATVPEPAVISPARHTSIDPDREVSWKRLVPNLARDQKQIWLFPVSVVRGHHLKPTLAIMGITAALMTVDAHNAKYFRNTSSFKGFNRAFSGQNTSILTEALPTILYGVGLARRDSYMQHTFLLAGEAVLDSEILTSVMKDIDRRLLPGEIPVNGNFSDSWFRRTSGSLIRGRGSFPSGHGIAAMAVATVIADRYPHPSWIPWTAYGLAGLVGFSRMPLQAHFTSDVFAGAALGYVIAHYVVLHRTRTSIVGAHSAK
jgi:membrane-associated phospholipid phosphatase